MLHNNCINYITKLTNEKDANVPHTKISSLRNSLARVM